MRFLRIYIFSAVLLLPYALLAQTNVSGTLSQNTQWTIGGSPYTLTGVLGVPPGVSLSIQPGVQVSGNFDLIVKGILHIDGDNGNTVKVQNTRILFKSTNLALSSIEYIDFNGGGVQLADESEFTEDNPKNSGVLLIRNGTFTNNAYGKTKGYQSGAKLRLQDCSMNNGSVFGYYPRSENIEIDNSTITNSSITSASYNLGIIITSSILTNCQLAMGCCSANFNISNSELTDCTVNEGGGQPVNGLFKLASTKLTNTFINLPSAAFSIVNCEISATQTQPYLIQMGNGEVKNTSINGISTMTLIKVSGYSGYDLIGSLNFDKVDFKDFQTALEVNNFGSLRIYHCNFLNPTLYALTNTSNKNINAKENYWDTSDPLIIQNRIYDLYDNINSGIVDYSGFLNSLALATPMITWSAPAAINYKTALSAAQLNATSDVAGTFTYSPPLETILNAGVNQTLSVNFTPDDAVNYYSVDNTQVGITVNKLNPVITWTGPAPINYKTALSASQLNAISNIAGTFSYNPALGTILNAGADQTLTVNFTPDDVANYYSVNNTQVKITVNKLNQIIVFNLPSPQTLGAPPFKLTATASSGLDINYSTTTDKVTISGNQITGVKAGTVTITANQPGNDNYNPAPSSDQSFCISPSKPLITLLNSDPATAILTSNSSVGNQWYFNDSALTGATDNTLSAFNSGTYKVQVTIDDCVSEFSSNLPVVVTGDLNVLSADIKAYPNPAENVLKIVGLKNNVRYAQLLAMTGAAFPISLEKYNETHQANLEGLVQGMYVIKVEDGESVHVIKFIKK